MSRTYHHHISLCFGDRTSERARDKNYLENFVQKKLSKWQSTTEINQNRSNRGKKICITKEKKSDRRTA